MAAVKRTKIREGEKLTPTNIQKVIGLLEAQKPITKKEACEILNITYNTSRLTNIIEEYKHDLEVDAKRRAENRGKPATPAEIQIVIENYLDGDSIAEIAKRLYRSAGFVKDIVDRVGVPQRGVGETYAKFSALPELCMADSFDDGEIVWSSKYQALAYIQYKHIQKSMNLDANLYHILVVEPFEEPSPYFPHITWGGFYGDQPAYDLGSLKHLQQYGIDLNRVIRK